MARKAFKEITNEEIRSASIASLADKPNTSSNYGVGGLSAEALKAQFDAFPRLVQIRLSEIISTLASTEAGQYIRLQDNKTGKDNLYDFIELFTDKTDDKDCIADFIYVLFQETPMPLSSAIKFIWGDINSIGTTQDTMHGTIYNLESKVNTFSDKLQKGEDALTKATAVEKRVTNLESQVNKDLIVTDSSVAYAKEVPARSAPYAEITKFGGMSYNPENIITFERYNGSISGSAWLTVSPDGSISVDNVAESTEEKVISTFSLGVGTYYLSTIQTHPYTRVNLRKNGTLLISLDGDDETYILSANNATDEYSISIVVLANGGFTTDRVKIMLHDFQGIRHAKPTAFKSVGANKFNPQWLLKTGYNVTITDDGFYRGQCSWFYAAYGQSPAQLPITDFKENTAYTISFEGYSENLSVSTLGFQFFYTDGTSDYSPFITGTTNKKYSVVTDSNKTLQKIIMTYSDGDYVRIKNICIIEGDVAEYVPYTENTLEILAVVQALDGYGYGVNANAYNHIEWKPDEGEKKYHRVIKKGIISNVFKPSSAYDNIQYFGFEKPTDFVGHNSTSNAFIIDGFATRENAGDWDNSAHIGSATGEAFWDSIWVGFPIGTTLAEAKAALEGKEWIYVLKNEEVTDISDILPDDNLIPVEGGGSIIAENDYNYDIPSEIRYQLRSAT